MDAITILLNRHSHPRLCAPAPEGQALENIMQAGLRAPDHACLTPWRFIVCTGQGLNKLGSLFEKSAIDNDKTEKEIERAPQLPLRAPLVVVAIMDYKAHEKVPRVEQIASTSCTVMAMQMAAQVQGFNGMWRTGAYAHCDVVKEGLGLKSEDEIIGFLYLGTPANDMANIPLRESSDYFEFWS